MSTGPTPGLSTEDHGRRAELLTVYQSLRQEILQADSLNYQIIGVSVAGSVALMSAAAASMNPVTSLVIALGVYVVVFPAYLLLCGNRQRTWRISTFLRLVLEEELVGAYWERGLDAQRRLDMSATSPSAAPPTRGTRLRPTSSGVNSREWLITTLLAGVGTAVAALLGAFRLDPWWVGVLVTCLLVAFFAVYAVLTRKRELSFRRNDAIETAMAASWTAVRGELVPERTWSRQ